QTQVEPRLAVRWRKLDDASHFSLRRGRLPVHSERRGEGTVHAGILGRLIGGGTQIGNRLGGTIDREQCGAEIARHLDVEWTQAERPSKTGNCRVRVSFA